VHSARKLGKYLAVLGPPGRLSAKAVACRRGEQVCRRPQAELPGPCRGPRCGLHLQKHPGSVVMVSVEEATIFVHDFLVNLFSAVSFLSSYIIPSCTGRFRNFKSVSAKLIYAFSEILLTFHYS
jgi:hypothetical protein